mgnify:CR=1 FL=1|tara:strand:+ start:905 stop:1264 length:360 start_codon:yes stop_codon:yes gene_type:complete
MKVLYFLFAIVNSEKIIKNINIPSCRNCVYYKPSRLSTDFTASYNKCNKFGEKDIMTNKISFDYANLCRNNEKKCGIEGKYFLLEKNIELKIMNHQIISCLPNILLVSSIILYISVMFR